MFEIPEELIAHSCTPEELKRGNEYYLQKRIKTIQFSRSSLTFDASVLGTRDYNVKAYFDNNGKLLHTTCTCPYFEDYNGFCRHIVAVLMLIKQKDRQGFFLRVRPQQSARQILGFFQNAHAGSRVPVNMEVVYEFNRASRYDGQTYSAISINIGENRLYIVRNIKKFLEALEKNEEIQFGKHFAFDPLKHYFRDEDKTVIDLLQEIFEIEKLSDERSYGGNRGSIFKDKQVFLTNSGTKRFFQLMKDRPFKAVIKDNVYEGVRILEKDFPVDFRISKAKDELSLSIDYVEPLLPLTEDGEYFFIGDNIYKASQKQQENFKPFYLAMAYQKSRVITFLPGDKELLVSEVLPFAEKAGTVIMDEDVSSMIEKLELDAQIYLDGDGGTVSGELRFVYGSRTINPFSSIEDRNQPADKILLRDVEKERLILGILEGTEFRVKNSRIHLDGEEKIFDFVYEIIPRLQEYASIFYSDSFKRAPVRDVASYTGSIRLNRHTDMLEFNFNIDGIERSELADILMKLREKRKYYRLKDGTFLSLNTKELHDMAEIADYLELGGENLQKEFFEIPKFRALYLDQQLKKNGLRYFERNHDFRELVQSINEPEDTELEIPVGLKCTLREYQKFGIKWLKTMSIYGMGAVLADDMGLGKTLQMIALILMDRNSRGSAPSLVIAPTSLVYNWYTEIEKFAPGLKTLIISGSREERKNLVKNISDTDIVITSYPLIRRDIDNYKGMTFRYCILDEAQYIKNPASQNARAVKKISSQNRFALTGTPMENTITELWSIFDFILPGYLFSNQKFVERYERPIIKDQDENVLEDLARHIRPFILRRLKADVLSELPEKIEHEMIAELTSEQKKVYMAYLKQVKDEIDREIIEKGFEKSHIRILAALTRLRQLCCHPVLFMEDFEGESGKMLLLQEIIQDSVDGGHRILLFSQFTSMLKLIQEWLNTKKIDYFYLDGATRIDERGRLVRAFNEGQGKIFLISLKAGGTGLNLTGADTVIHYDPWWNPAVEDQATDRAYRIGQTRAVHVIKLLTKGTIEEKIFNLQQRKKKLIDAVIQPGDTMLAKMSEEEVRALFE